MSKHQTYSILFLDDDINNLDLLKNTFSQNYTVYKALNYDEAFSLLEEYPINIVITDYKLPHLNGVEFLKEVYEKYPDTIRILITTYTDPAILIDAINSGKINQFIKKPYNHEELKQIIDSLVTKNKLKIDNINIINSYNELFAGTISAIIEALDAKDSYTLGRSKRVTFLVVHLLKQMNLSEIEGSKICLASLLHNIGMIGVPESILNKTTPLTDEEYGIIKNHVNYGIYILKDIKQLAPVLDIIKYHHEKYDGTGYPYGIKGDEIPIGSMIIAISDTYDSIISNRPYKEKLSHDKALEIIKEMSGTQFNPAVVDAFLQIPADVFDKLNNLDADPDDLL